MLKNSVNMVTITSAANNSLHLQSLSSENKNSHLLEASFSSYLNSNEENFGKRLADSSRSLNHFISREDDDVLHHLGKKKEEDGEIGVFSAEKYFNGGIEDSPRLPNMPARKFHHHPRKDKQEAAAPEESRKSKVPSRGTTPSVRSESSWNSQSALLKAAVKNCSRNGSKKKDQGKSFLANLGCNCYCSDKDSVDISSNTSGEISFSKNASFGVVQEKAIPKKVIKTVSSGLENQLVNMQIQPQEEEEEEKERKSLEVFGSPIPENKSRSMSFDKRLTITMPSPSSSSWDHHHIVAAPKMEQETIDFSANSGGNYINDAASDASSDLFEIESFTGSKSNPYLARQASDATHTSGCVTPTTCYAPSEASIEWSVVTASAAEYSVMSDCEEQRPMDTTKSPIIRSSFASTNGKNNKGNRDIQRRRSGSLLGCKSHKAVRVVGDAFIRNEKSSSNTQRPQVTKMVSFDPRHGQNGFASQPVQRSHSPHASQHLYF